MYHYFAKLFCKLLESTFLREISLNNKYRFKSIRLAVLRAIFVSHPKLMLHCILHFGVIFTQFTMPGPPGELMTREKLISRECVCVCVCVCVCIPILVTTFPEWLSGTEPLPHTPGAVRPSSLCL